MPEPRTMDNPGEYLGIIKRLMPDSIKDDKAFQDYLLLSGTAHMARYNAAIFEKANQIDTALNYLIQADDMQARADAIRGQAFTGV